MKNSIITTFLLLNTLLCFSQIQIGQDIDGEAASDLSGLSVSLSSDGLAVAIGAPYNDDGGIDAGHVRVYVSQGGVWIQKGQDIDGEMPDDLSGYSISLADENTVAIGAYKNDGNGTDAGHVRIYQWNGSNWIQKGMDIDGEAAGDWSGYAVSMADPNTVAIGAYKNDGSGTDAGHVRIYSWNGSAWLQKGTDIDGELPGDGFGRSISMPNVNSIAIGASYNDGNGISAGHVRIYNWNGSTWQQKGTDIDGEAAGDFFGGSVALSSDLSTVAIGAESNDGGSGANSGHVRVFKWNGSDWQQQGTDIDGEASGDYSGPVDISSDGSNIVIGAPFNDGNGNSSGHARNYKWNGNNWVQVGIDIDGERNYDNFGKAVDLSSDGLTVAIGAYSSDNNGVNSGHVRIFKLEGISGFLYNDINLSCIKDSNELGVIAGLKGVITPGNIIVETNNQGQWYLDSLPSGTYTMTYDTSGNWKTSCSNTQTFTINNTDTMLFLPSLGMYNTNPCSEPEVSISMPFMRPGFSNQNILVRASNSSLATGTLANSYVLVEVDTLITVDTSSIPYTMQGSLYRFDLGDISPGNDVSFSISATVSLNAILGQTLCMQANLYPVENCLLDTIETAPTPPDFTPCTLPWDKSSIQVNGWCQNDSIYFTITNTGDFGDGDMDCYSPVRLYIDGQDILLDSVQLLGQETDTLIYSGDGRTFRLEVDQHPLHPGNSRPNATIELCGNADNWTPDLVNVLPHDDLDPIKDIYCGVVTGSYDPNDKTGYPLGVTDSHFVSPNGKLDYVIRFQNTGTDTAFTVVIRDTLDTDLDIFSVREGVSSHDYEFRMYGPRILEWTFNDILLPDSNVDVEGSNGFATFTVNQVKNLPDYTEINNSVGIYFDFNAPVITNTTSHIVKRAVKQQQWNVENQILDTNCISVIYNANEYSSTGTYFTLKGDTLSKINAFIYGQPIVEAGSDTSLCLNDNIVLSASGAQTYTWSNGVVNGVSFAPINTQCYSVVGIDSNGCENIDSVFISVYDTIPQAEFSYQLTGFEVSLNDSSSIDVNSWYWSIGEDSLSNSTQANYEFAENGIYDVCLIASNDCFSDTLCKQITISGVGIEHQLGAGNIKVYPNPVTNQLSVELNDVNKEITSIQLIDVSGRVIDKQIASFPRNDGKILIDVSELETGIYIYNILSNNEILGVGEIMKK